LVYKVHEFAGNTKSPKTACPPPHISTLPADWKCTKTATARAEEQGQPKGIWDAPENLSTNHLSTTEKDGISEKMPTFAAPRTNNNSQDDYDQNTDENDDKVH
jgi:hypothetical protein